MAWMQWYGSLEKPVWTPEPETIGFIWQVLYPIILISFSYVFLKVARGTIPWCRRPALCRQSCCESGVHTDFIWVAELSPCFIRYCGCTDDNCIGNGYDLAVSQVGCRCPSSVFDLGFHCDVFATGNYANECSFTPILIRRQL